ncbi:MAG: Gfo/Idh/MocA family oxidoreductase [Acidobacteriota bacterium]|nr:Gfo/Idh/MocA family oxidoreductase [Acidobacteriota bacterium]
MAEITRRDLGRATGIVTALSYSRILGANEQVRMGYVGVGNRGDQVHDAFLESGGNQTVAVCDLRDDYMDFAVHKSRAAPKKYRDYRKLLEDKDVDAVVIATPDHWHALMFADACRTGKDVYVEKPLSRTVAEGRKMVEIAAETKRVVQVGIQRRSSPFLKEAAELVRSGGIGPVTVARSFHVINMWPNGIGNPPDSAPPNEKLWDEWLGPAPRVPYNVNRTFYDFRWFYDYSGGQITNFGVHYMDMLRWCLGKDAPRAVTAMGGKYAVADDREIPDTLEALWQFDNGNAPATMVTFSQYSCNGASWNAQNSEMELRGAKGTMYLHGSRWEVLPEKITDKISPARTPLDRVTEKSYNPSRHLAMEPKSAKGSSDTALHTRNFLDCVKSRAKCNCDVETGHRSTAATLIANIALKTKSYLEWDGRAERFTNNDAANKLLQYKYRSPYKLT